jgi:post-segregation antitoxin (ccd killing protein)
MRQSMTIRIDQDLLNQAKACAVLENRTLTNYIETLILKDVRPQPARPANNTTVTPLTVFIPEPSAQRLRTLERDGDTPQDLAQRQAYLDLISGWAE